MKLSRISLSGIDGPEPRSVLVLPEAEVVVDLVKAEQLRLMRKGATAKRALEISRAKFPGSMAQCIATGPRFLEDVAEVAELSDDASIPFGEIDWLSAVDPPMIRDCIAFIAHLEAYYTAMGHELSKFHYRQPGYYKGTNARCFGHNATVPWPHYTDFVDYECELGFVVGQECNNLTADEAKDALFGVTVFNDYSARDYQNDEMQIGMGPTKSKDFANGLGPWITTMDEIEDLSKLKMSVEVNGEARGGGVAGDMQWKPEELLAYISQGDIVQPGDVFGSGTVGGGSGLEWGEGPKPGDAVDLTIEGIGTLRQIMGQKEEKRWHPTPRPRWAELSG